MSGLQDITAIFAVTELAIKSLSALYNFIQTLKHIPTRIKQAKGEIEDLLNCLAGLRFIQTADILTISVIDQTGLETSVSSCRKACDELQALLSTWNPKQSSIEAKLKYFRDRKTFDGLLDNITARKQNTILALGITQLSLQASSQQATISNSESIQRFVAMHNYPNRPTISAQQEERRQDEEALDEPMGGLDAAGSDSINANSYLDQPESMELTRSSPPVPGGDNTALIVGFPYHDVARLRQGNPAYQHGAGCIGPQHETKPLDPTSAQKALSQVFEEVELAGKENKAGMPGSLANSIANAPANRKYFQQFKNVKTTADSSGNTIGMW